MAAGKSTVSRRLAELGACVIDADQAARQVVLPGTEGLAALAARFGPGILLPGGELDRPALAALAFGNADALTSLNAVLHPRIRAEMEGRMAQARKRGEAVAVLDVPLLLESGWQDMCDEVWLVTAPEEIRLTRAMARDGISREEAKARMAAQMPEEEKRALADVVLENGGSLEELLAQVDARYGRFRKGKR